MEKIDLCVSKKKSFELTPKAEKPTVEITIAKNNQKLRDFLMSKWENNTVIVSTATGQNANCDFKEPTPDQTDTDNVVLTAKCLEPHALHIAGLSVIENPTVGKNKYIFTLSPDKTKFEIALQNDNPGYMAYQIDSNWETLDIENEKIKFPYSMLGKTISLTVNPKNKKCIMNHGNISTISNQNNFRFFPIPGDCPLQDKTIVKLSNYLWDDFMKIANDDAQTFGSYFHFYANGDEEEINCIFQTVQKPQLLYQCTAQPNALMIGSYQLVENHALRQFKRPIIDREATLFDVQHQNLIADVPIVSGGTFWASKIINPIEIKGSLPIVYVRNEAKYTLRINPHTTSNCDIDITISAARLLEQNFALNVSTSSNEGCIKIRITWNSNWGKPLKLSNCGNSSIDNHETICIVKNINAPVTLDWGENWQPIKIQPNSLQQTRKIELKDFQPIWTFTNDPWLSEPLLTAMSCEQQPHYQPITLLLKNDDLLKKTPLTFKPNPFKLPSLEEIKWPKDSTLPNQVNVKFNRVNKRNSI